MSACLERGDGRLNMFAEERQRAWDGRLDAERNYRYYRALADRYRLYYQSAAFAIAVASLFAGALYAWDHPLGNVFAAIASVMAALVMVFLISFEIPIRAARADSAATYYQELVDEWRSVWWNHFGESVLEDIKKLEARMNTCPQVPISVNKKLNNRCIDEAEKIVEAEYL